MFGVLMVTLLLTIALVGSNMDSILRQGVSAQVRGEIAENPAVAESFGSPAELDAYVRERIDERAAALGLDEPWHSPHRLGMSMYRVLVLDFGHATFLTSDSGSSDVREILLEKMPRTILLFTTATVAISVIGVLLGSLAGSRVGSKTDRITSAFAVVSSSFPVWWIGMLVIFAFAFTYQVFPARATPSLPPGDPGYAAALLYHMVLPLITIVAVGFGSKTDRITSAFAVVSSSFPVWWIGMLVIFAFAFTYQVFPARATPSLPPGDPGYAAALLYHMVLPLITIVAVGFGSWAYLVRNFMAGIMQEDYIAAKRTMGVPARRIVYGHALRNAAPPIVTILALSLSGSLGGAVITEAVFDWPGMGRLYFDAITVMDLPVIVGATYVLTAFFLASILAADVLYGYFDPRVRTGGAPR